MTAPTVDLDGRTYVLVEQEPGSITRPGPVILISRREAVETLAKLDRYLVDPGRKRDPMRKSWQAKLKAFGILIAHKEG